MLYHCPQPKTIVGGVTKALESLGPPCHDRRAESELAQNASSNNLHYAGVGPILLCRSCKFDRQAPRDWSHRDVDSVGSQYLLLAKTIGGKSHHKRFDRLATNSMGNTPMVSRLSNEERSEAVHSVTWQLNVISKTASLVTNRHPHEPRHTLCRLFAMVAILSSCGVWRAARMVRRQLSLRSFPSCSSGKAAYKPLACSCPLQRWQMLSN